MLRTFLKGCVPGTSCLVALVLLSHARAASAQWYDSKAQTPMALLAVPTDGVAYHEARVKARALLADKRFVEAEPIVEMLVRDYPRDGENWIMQARVKANLRKHIESARAYEEAGRLLGTEVPYLTNHNAAIQYQNAGDSAAAMAALRRAIYRDRSLFRASALDWSQFASLKSNPAFMEMMGRPSTSGWSRNEGWARDIDHLYAEVKRVNPDYHSAPFPAEFERRYAELKAQVPQLSDEELFVGMNRMLGALKQGHLELFTPKFARYLPLRPYTFPEGVFIIEADPAYKELAGARIIEIESTPVAEVQRHLSESRSVDGDMRHLWTSELAATAYLKGVRAITRTDSVTLTIQKSGRQAERIKLPTLPTARPGRQDRLVAPPGVTPPLFLRDVEQKHWEVALPEHDALYVQMNNVVDDKDETLDQFALRLRRLLAQNPPKNLILDLRHNNGGATSMYPEFLRTVIGYSTLPGSQLYVLIGRRTYSATANLITDLERLAEPIFVGEASSECCNLYGDPAYVVLPYSGIDGELTAAKWNLSYNVFDGRREMSPDVPVQLTATAYFAGEDPALAAVFKLISARRD